jgi:hypothetical protein
MEMLTADGLDAAIIGVGARCGQPDIVAYDVEKVLEILVARDGMSYEEALEFYEFNIEGAWVGDQTPLWVRVGVIPQEEE